MSINKYNQSRVFNNTTKDMINKMIKNGVLQNWNIIVADEEMEKFTNEFV